MHGRTTGIGRRVEPVCWKPDPCGPCAQWHARVIVCAIGAVLPHPANAAELYSQESQSVVGRVTKQTQASPSTPSRSCALNGACRERTSAPTRALQAIASVEKQRPSAMRHELLRLLVNTSRIVPAVMLLEASAQRSRD